MSEQVPEDFDHEANGLPSAGEEKVAAPEAEQPPVVHAEQPAAGAKKKGGGNMILWVGGALLSIPIVLAVYNSSHGKSGVDKKDASQPAQQAQMPGTVSDGMSGNHASVSSPKLPEGAMPGEAASNPDVARLQSEMEKKREASAGNGTYVSKIGNLNDRAPNGNLPPVQSLNNSATFPQQGRFPANGTGASPEAAKNALAFLRRQPQESKIKTVWYAREASNPVTAVGLNAAMATQSATTGRTLAEMGEVCLAVTTTASSSYDGSSTPVFGRILSCKNPALRNAAVSGKYRVSNDKLVVEINRVRLADGRELKANALFVDKSTRRPGIASSVDGHYMQRFGMLAASAFLSSYAQGVSQSQQVVYPNTTTTVVVSGQKTTKQAALAAAGATLGAVQQDLAKSAAAVSGSEVLLDRGQTVGLMFVDSLTE